MTLVRFDGVPKLGQRSDDRSRHTLGRLGPLAFAGLAEHHSQDFRQRATYINGVVITGAIRKGVAVIQSHGMQVAAAYFPNPRISL
jgi:hypothetical protein